MAGCTVGIAAIGAVGRDYHSSLAGMQGKRLARTDEERADMEARLAEKLQLVGGRTVFFPGHRVRMNIVPMFLNLFGPWLVFICCCGLTGFWLMYKDSRIVKAALLNVFMLWLCAAMFAYRARKDINEPSWYTYLALMLGLAAAGGVASGLSIFFSFSKPYYDVSNLKVAHNLDVGRELGQNLMDAGIAYFAHGNRLAPLKSWHFKHRTLYCVAPIVSNDTKAETGTYDFWAVGEDCCAVEAPDFRCGAWANPAARSGIRVLDSQDLMYYRLAVKQAETLYGIVATHPIFFTWVQDPVAEINSWSLQAYKNYVFLVALAFVASLICLVGVTAKFAWIGRASSAYGMDFKDDPEWSNANGARPSQGRTRDYSTV